MVVQPREGPSVLLQVQEQQQHGVQEAVEVGPAVVVQHQADHLMQEAQEGRSVPSRVQALGVQQDLAVAQLGQVVGAASAPQEGQPVVWCPQQQLEVAVAMGTALVRCRHAGHSQCRQSWR